MSITDELREWWVRKFPIMDKELHKDFTAIADRIDAEHERQCAEAWMRGHDAWAAIDRSDEMAEHGWVRLPKDADGEYIRIGDVMNSKVDYLFDGKPFTVRGLVLREDGWEAADGRFGNRYDTDSLCHYHAPTVEDVLREFTDAILDWAGKSGPVAEVGTWSDVATEYAAKLRLAGDTE